VGDKTTEKGRKKDQIKFKDEVIKKGKERKRKLKHRRETESSNMREMTIRNGKIL
jgi:hypothetical protein